MKKTKELIKNIIYTIEGFKNGMDIYIIGII